MNSSRARLPGCVFCNGSCRFTRFCNASDAMVHERARCRALDSGEGAPSVDSGEGEPSVPVSQVPQQCPSRGLGPASGAGPAPPGGGAAARAPSSAAGMHSVVRTRMLHTFAAALAGAALLKIGEADEFTDGALNKARDFEGRVWAQVPAACSSLCSASHPPLALALARLLLPCLPPLLPSRAATVPRLVCQTS